MLPHKLRCDSECSLPVFKTVHHMKDNPTLLLCHHHMLENWRTLNITYTSKLFIKTKIPHIYMQYFTNQIMFVLKHRLDWFAAANLFSSWKGAQEFSLDFVFSEVSSSSVVARGDIPNAHAHSKLYWENKRMRTGNSHFFSEKPAYGRFKFRRTKTFHGYALFFVTVTLKHIP